MRLCSFDLKQFIAQSSNFISFCHRTFHAGFWLIDQFSFFSFFLRRFSGLVLVLPDYQDAVVVDIDRDNLCQHVERSNHCTVESQPGLVVHIELDVFGSQDVVRSWVATQGARTFGSPSSQFARSCRLRIIFSRTSLPSPVPAPCLNESF